MCVLAGLGPGRPLAAEPESTVVLPEIQVIGKVDRLSEIAGSGQILDQKTLEKSRVFTTNEALRKLPGVNVRDEEGFGLRPNIGLRGLNPTRSTKVLLLEDGIPLAYAPYGDNASYYHPPIERFSSIEVLKGAEQVLFGPQTIGGVINYITPSVRKKPGGNVTLTGGNRDYFNGHLQVGGYNTILDVTHKRGEGARDNTDSELNDVNLKAVIDLGNRQAITLRGNYYAEDSTVTYSGITDAERRNFGLRYNPFKNDEFDTSRYGGSATYKFDVNKDLILSATVYGSVFKRDWWRQASTTTDSQCGSSFRDARLAGRAVNVDACDSVQGRLRDYYTWGVEPRLNFFYKLLGLENELKTGFRAHFENQFREQVNGESARARSGERVEDNNRFTDAYSGFLQNRINFGKWALTPGFRVEHVRFERENLLTGAQGDFSLTEWIPSVGLTFNPVDNTTFFASFLKGFAPPRTEDVILTPSGDPTATFSDVDAEESWSYEAGVRSNIVKGVTAHLTYFRNDFSNQIAVGSIAGGGVPLSQGEALYQGVELFGRIDSAQITGSPHNIYAQLAYTWLPTADQENVFRQAADGTALAGSATGNRMPYAPEHLLTASVGYAHTSGWDVSLEVVHVSEQFADFANCEDAATCPDLSDRDRLSGQFGRIESYTVMNAAVNYTVKPANLTLFFAAKNLTDHDYIVDRSRGILPGSPLLVQGGLRFAF